MADQSSAASAAESAPAPAPAPLLDLSVTTAPTKPNGDDRFERLLETDSAYIWGKRFDASLDGEDAPLVTGVQVLYEGDSVPPGYECVEVDLGKSVRGGVFLCVRRSSGSGGSDAASPVVALAVHSLRDPVPASFARVPLEIGRGTRKYLYVQTRASLRDGKVARRWHLGDLVDCKDSVNKWEVGRIVRIDYEQRRLFVHYEGWTDRWSEWVSMDATDRVQPYMSRTHGLRRPLPSERKKQPVEMWGRALTEMRERLARLRALMAVPREERSEEDVAWLHSANAESLRDVLNSVVADYDVIDDVVEYARLNMQLLAEEMRAPGAMPDGVLLAMRQLFDSDATANKFFRWYGMKKAAYADKDGEWAYRPPATGGKQGKKKKPPSSWHIALLNQFGELGGFDALSARLKAESGEFPLRFVEMHTFVRSFWGSRRALRVELFERMVGELSDAISKRVLELSDEELKVVEKKSFKELMTYLEGLQRETAGGSEPQFFEMLELDFSLRLLSTRLLRKRILGIGEIQYMLQRVRARDVRPDRYARQRIAPTRWLTDEHAAEWIIERNLIGTLFGPSTHPELIKRSFPIVQTLAAAGRLTDEHLAIIHDSCAGKHESHVLLVYDIIARTVPLLVQKPELIATAFDRIKAGTPLYQYKAMHLDFLKKFTINAVAATRGLPVNERSWFGLDIMWQLAQDNSGVSNELAIAALETLCELLAHADYVRAREHHIKAALESVRNGTSVAQALLLLQGLSERAGCSRLVKELAQHEEHGSLLDQVVADLKRVMAQANEVKTSLGEAASSGRAGAGPAQSSMHLDLLPPENGVTPGGPDGDDDLPAPPPSSVGGGSPAPVSASPAPGAANKPSGWDAFFLVGRFQHARQIDVRLEFIEFVLDRSLFQLSREQVDSMWASCVTDHVSANDTSRLLAFLAEGRDTESAHLRIGHAKPTGCAYFEPDVTDHIFHDLLCNPDKFDLAAISPDGYVCLEMYFHMVAVAAGAIQLAGAGVNSHAHHRSKKFVVLDFASLSERGVEAYWRLLAEAKHREVFEQASSFLLALHVRLSDSLDGAARRAIYRRFVERCIALLRDASASVEGGQELETMRPKIVRTVLLLGSFLAQVEQTSYCPDMSSVPVGNASIRIAVQIYKGRRRISSRVVLLPGSQSIASLRRQLAKNLKCQPPTLQFEYRGRILYPEEYDHLTVSEARIRGGAIEEIVVTCLPDGTPNCRPARDESARAAAATAASGSSDASVLEQLEPRDLLANNAPYFDMLFRLLRLGGPVARQVWRLLDWLPVNSLLETHVARAVGLADDGDAAEAAAAIDWSVILDASSPLRLLYVLQILDKHLLVGENASAATQTRVQAARQAFIDNGGLVQLHRILVELDLDAVFADSMPQQCLAHLLSLVAHLEESVTEEHRAAGLGRPAGEEAESTAAVRLLGMLHATATSDLTARELEERARQLEAEKQQQGAGFADDSSDDEASTTAAADSSDDEDEADGGAEDVGLTTVASIQAKLADQILSTLRSLFTSSPARLSTLFDNAAQLEETLQAALLQHPSRELRKCVAAGVCALCEQFAVKAGAEPNAAVERTPRAVVLPIAVRVVDRLTPDMFCRELFELLQALVAMDDVASADAFDPEGLGRKLANKIVDHPIVEVNPHDRDEMLQGLLRSMQALVQQHEALKEPLAEEASLLESLFSDCLFKYPESKLKGVLWPPKCKSETSRREAFALLAELAKGSEKNFRALLALIEPNHLEPHSTGHVFQQWDFEPRREIQSDTGYVGLKNLGCICYMNSTIQQLFMLPALRKNILTIDQETIEPPPEDQGNDEDAAAGDASAVAPASDATAAVTPGGVPEAEKEKEKDEEPDSDAEDMVPFGMSPSQSNSWFFQLQYIFGFLQESQRQYANPGGFCHTFTDWEGNPTNVHEQMDADEFLNLLFDRLDTKVNGTPYETTLRDSLGGSFAQQMIGHGKCVHAREREEKFYVVSLAIQNKRTLEEALEAFIAGEMMEGDNALNCDGCGTKADTLKRSCLKELGPTVIFHLKRFEFDFDLMRKRKLNDRLEFPRKINLFPYTKEGLAESERRERGQQAGAVEDEDEAKADDDEEDVEVEDGDGVQTEEDAEAARQAAAEAERRAVLEAEPKDAGYYEYELSGVLVHTGSADRGHYYSFIRERLEPEELAAGRKPRWFQFNDTIVRPFDPRRLEDECFGGEVEQTIGGRWGGSTRRKIAKYRNAYMLFYDRVVPVQGGDSSAATAADEAEPEAAEDLPDAGQHDQLVARVRRQKSFVQVPVPPAIYSKVWEENKTFWRDRFIFDPVYFEFAGDVVSALQIEPTRALPAPGDGNDDMGELVTRVSARFVFETLARARRKESFSQWILRLHQLVRASGPATSWMLRRLAMEPGAAGRPESEEVSDWSLDFLMRSTTKAVRRQTAALFADVVAQGVSYVSSEDEWTGAVPRFSAVDLLYSYADHLCSLLKDAAANWKRFDRYFQVCQEMANAHPRLAQRMVGNRMVARMIDLVLGDASPHKEISDIAVDPRTKRRPAIGNQYVNPVFTNYLELLATLVCAAHPSTERRAELPATTFIGAERKAKRRSRWHYRDDEGRELYGSVDGALCDCVLDAVDVDMLANVKFLDWLCSQGTTRRRGLAVCEVLCHVAWGNIEFSRVVVGCSTRGLRRVGARDVRSFLRVLTALATMRDGDATPAYGGGDFDSDLNAQLASVHPSQRKQKMAELRAAKEKELADKLGGRSLEVLNDGLPQHNKERVAVVMEGLTGVMQAQQGYYWMTRVCIDHVVRMAKQSPAVQEWLHAHPDVTGWMNDFATMWQREPTAYESRIRLWKHDYYDRRPKPNQSGLSNKQVRAALAEISAGVPVNDNGVEDSDEEFRASRTFEVGQWIDCRDTVDKWLEARITAVDEQNRQVSISYDGWPAKWDETLDWDDDRIQRFGRHTSDRPDKKKKGAGPRIKDHLGEGRLFAGPARAPKAPKKKKGKKS